MKSLLLFSLTTLTLIACGRGGDDDKAEPPPTKAGDATATIFALESGTYYVEQVSNLVDGCNRAPVSSPRPITVENYALTNDGSGNVSLERCVFDNKMVTGRIEGNRGTLSITHPSRRDSVGEGPAAVYQQECLLTVELTANNTMKIDFVERQSARNAVMKAASEVNSDECTTSYKMIMKKR